MSPRSLVGPAPFAALASAAEFALVGELAPVAKLAPIGELVPIGELASLVALASLGAAGAKSRCAACAEGGGDALSVRSETLAHDATDTTTDSTTRLSMSVLLSAAGDLIDPRR